MLNTEILILITFIFGISIGILSSSTVYLLHTKLVSSFGVFEIDTQNNLCNIIISTEEIRDEQIKRVILKIKRK